MNGMNGEAGAPGASGSATVNPSVSGITPPQSFLALTSDVTISGYGTTWSSSTKVSFGMDVTVNKITVASPTALLVNISTGKTAATGPRDVTITDGSNTETYTGAFQVLSPIVASFEGTAAQGSLAILDLKDIDVTTPFDTTSTTDPLSGQTTYTNIALTLPTGVTNQAIESVGDFSMQVLVSVDVDAAAAAGDIDVLSGPMGAATDVEFPLPKGFTITARTATALTAGTAAMGTISTAYDSALYSFTPGSALAIVDFEATSSSMTASPAFALLPSSGEFAGLLGYGASQITVTDAAQPLYAVYWDNTGATGPFSLTVTSTAPAASAAASNSDGTKTGAVSATAFPFVLTGGNLADTAGADWVKVTTGAGSAGQTLTAQTIGDPLTDALLTIYDSTGTNILDQEETGTLVSAMTTVTASTVYYVVFAAGTVFSATDATYTGLITLQ
jgi:hypothetical protein